MSGGLNFIKSYEKSYLASGERDNRSTQQEKNIDNCKQCN